MEPTITFDRVTKLYPLYHAVRGGIKGAILSPMKTLATLRTHSYPVLTDVSFSVTRGEAVGLVGRNGAGKSTTLGLVAGVLRPTAGSVTVHGRVAPMLELGGGFHSDLTGRENIMLNAVLLGMTRRQAAGAMDRIIEFSELGEFIDEPIRVYSSGMLAKLGFSVITQLDPEILIIDEVLAVGDIPFQRKCVDAISRFKQRGVTILFVSHSLEAVAQVCDRALWIENHRVRMDSTVGEVTAAYGRACGQ
jgi:lipopolysaccharide transport system ATP-binding protein